MPDFTKAVNYLLNSEGGLYESPVTHECSNFGISLKWLETIDPEATADTIRNLSRDAAIDLYYKYWWRDIKLDQIPNDNIATKMLDICVNCGPQTGIKLLQSTLNQPLEPHEEHITCDGLIGPATIAAIQAELTYPNGEFMLLAALVSELEDHYNTIAEAHPELAGNLAGWLARAEKLPG